MAASLYSNVVNRAPIIVITGATGTGKSKLAIELALKFKAEVINADSMQVYNGLDIATNKVTEKEQQGVRHHLLGYLDPKKNLLVQEFRNVALKTIKDITERGKLPIIVGGTNYYIESVLYNVLIDSLSSDEKDGEGGQFENAVGNSEDDNSTETKKMKLSNEWKEKEFQERIEKLDNVTLHEKLREVDPDMADVLHPNNRRKIIRSLQVYEQCGETLSTLLKRQRSVPGGSDTGGPLRFTNSIVLWLQCDSEVLKERLDERVNAMLSEGLVEELLDFHIKYNKNNCSNDYTRGILQTIGFKEFKDYLSLDEDDRKSENGKKLFQNGVELLKIATKQYATRQKRWIRNRFLKNAKRQVPPIYGLDATDLSKWNENVLEKASDIVECHLMGRQTAIEPLPIIESEKIPIDKSYHCQVCDRIFVGKFQWESHVESKKHRGVLRKMERMKKEEEEKRKSEGSLSIVDS